MFPSVENSTSDLSTLLTKSKVAKTQTGEGGKSFMRFDFESGDYQFGKEGEDITGEEIVVNTMSFMHGWTLWSNGKPTKKEVHFTEELPVAMDGIGADQPSESRSFEARFSDDADTILVFNTTSYGGKKGADSLLDAIMLKSAGGEAQYLYPVVTLTSESYANAKRGGKLTYNPTFAVKDWMDAEGNLESATAKLDKPKRKTKKAAPVEEIEEIEEIEEVEEVEEAPKKRRRKKAE